MRTALISGAGIAGATAAYWLAKAGFQVTVVEQARDMRSSGSPVDVRGPAVEIADRMGVMARVRDADTSVRNMVFVNARGRVVSRVDMRTTWAESGDVELARGELAAILREAVPDDVEFQFGNSVTALAQHADGVTRRIRVRVLPADSTCSSAPTGRTRACVRWRSVRRPTTSSTSASTSPRCRWTARPERISSCTTRRVAPWPSIPRVATRVPRSCSAPQRSQISTTATSSNTNGC